MANNEEPEFFDKEFLRLWFKERFDPYKDKKAQYPKYVNMGLLYYPVLMAVSSKSGKNISGEYVVKMEKEEQIIDFDLPEIGNRFRRFVENEKLWKV